MRQGYEYVLIVGTVTNVCCESSARDSMMLNFKTIMVSDGNSAHTDAEHTATLAAFYAIVRRRDGHRHGDRLPARECNAAGSVAAE